MAQTISETELMGLVGRELGVSEWFHVDQERVDRFADVTEDHQFVHVDPVRAAETPFGGTIVHGFLTLSLLVHLCLDFVPEIEGRQVLLNYGFDKVRFISPIKVGSRIRARTRLAEVAERKPGQFLMSLDVKVDIEGEDRVALAARWLSLHIVNS